ncbi:restriction endonuclease subunit S [[Mycoplasma] mobile]|uniref:Restriction-modification enzyme mpuUVIII s subunit n=1 Tax=Mycoplasma mobile (strain ATCC 43663 / 163K / NCTC 11711) TaxID=267748 RepID=Q6KI05_MYCM1|nr:restriction endonuclease subunit S [[Mycoplasma] mobile]AAT27771.1 restriction-modification enzyme mpuUVIII s subunit [Mycoplasma mobile 163K]
MKKIYKSQNEPLSKKIEVIKTDKIFEINKGRSKISKKDISDNHGIYPVYSSKTTNNGILGWINRYDYNDELITLTSEGYAGTAFYHINEKFNVTGDSFVLKVKNKDITNTKFMFYFLQKEAKNPSNLNLLNNFSGTLTKSNLSKIEIPLPPIQYQDEIVRILNNFSEILLDLKKEFELRKKQYEYYRNKLFLFSEQTEYVSIDKIFEINKGKSKISKKDISDNPGIYPVYSSKTTNNGILGWINRYEDQYEDELITITVGGYAGTVFYHDNKKINVTEGSWILKAFDKNNVNIKFVFYALEIIAKKYVTKSSTMLELKKSSIEKIKIPLPSIEIQNKIVKNLNFFEILIKDFKEGLPSEINLRKKQYEYYRDKLLKFDLN